MSCPQIMEVKSLLGFEELNPVLFPPLPLFLCLHRCAQTITATRASAGAVRSTEVKPEAKGRFDQSTRCALFVSINRMLSGLMDRYDH